MFGEIAGFFFLLKINIDLIKTFPILFTFYDINSMNFNEEFPNLMIFFYCKVMNKIGMFFTPPEQSIQKYKFKTNKKLPEHMFIRFLTSLATIRSFSKLIRPSSFDAFLPKKSTLVSLPKWIKVKSLFTIGYIGIIGGWKREKKMYFNKIGNLTWGFKRHRILEQMEPKMNLSSPTLKA